MKNPSPAERNRINREFWAAEKIAGERLMADPEIFGRAITLKRLGEIITGDKLLSP